MIVDRVEHWDRYAFGPAWASAFEFIQSLGPDAPEQRYALRGEDLYALVISGETRPRADALLEAHQNYVDVQAPLAGAEGFEWAPLDGLTVQTPYDATGDAALYEMPQQVAARVDGRPGVFLTFFPQDAHAPQLMVGDPPQLVKKVVVKIRMELLKT